MTIKKPFDLPASQPEEERAPEIRFPMPDEYLKKMEDLGFSEQAEAYQKVLEIAKAIRAKGGLALLVGGSVRDTLMGRISKDFDIEVYKLSAEEIEEVVEQFGKVSEVGRAFGILKIALEVGMDIDVSLPRTDSKVGKGHKGFEVKTDPGMSIKEAARRRDFTMNTVAADPLTGEFYDHFGGVDDIRKRILRVTDEERFKDDPLRVLRALQFIGRFGLEIDKDSIPLIQEMAAQLPEIPKERVGEEWKKLLLKSEKPSLGLSAGMMLGVFKEIHPEFPPLAETEQEPEWHPEGDVWIHTLMVVDEAAKLVKRERLEKDKAMTIMLSALCHDLGKPEVTEVKEGRITSRGHEEAGGVPTHKFLASLGVPNVVRDKVVKLVMNHLVPTLLYIDETIRGNKIKDGSIRRLAKRIYPATIQELVLLGEADHLGRGPFDDPEVKEQLLLPPDRFAPGAWLLERARALEVEDSKPADLTRGRDWVQLGYRPGEDIGKLISLSNDLRDDKNFSREMVFEVVDDAKNTKEALAKLKSVIEKDLI